MGKRLLHLIPAARRCIFIQFLINRPSAVHQHICRRQIVDRHRLLVMQKLFHHRIFHFTRFPALLHLLALVFLLRGGILFRHPVCDITHDIPIKFREAGFDLFRNGNALLDRLNAGKSIIHHKVHACSFLAAHRTQHVFKGNFRACIDQRPDPCVIRLLKLPQHTVNTDIGRPFLFRNRFIFIQFI